jgi:hypothetical protein
MPNDTIGRPALLTPTALALSLINVLGVLLLDPSAGSFRAFLLVYVLLAAVSFAVIWFFWRGQNWARWLVLATSALSLVNITSMPSLTRAGTILVVTEAGVAIWLLYWLNTKPVALYFRRAQWRPTLARTAVVTVSVVAGVAVLLVAALAGSMAYAPTLRPVYGDGISPAHREALRGLHPGDERLLGLFSRGVFDVAEEGCLFTDRRVLVFEDGKVIVQAPFQEIRDVQLRRELGFVGNSELTVVRHDGTRLYCPLPNASAYANDAAEFHERMKAARRR